QVVLHMRRDRTGSRHLSEVGLLERGVDGRVSVLPCWDRQGGFGRGADSLEALVRSRKQA
nr:conjugal transfer protein [Actinomycetes bacterium]